MLDFVPSSDLPGLQYIEHVDAGSSASDAGLLPSDFVLEVRVVIGLILLYNNASVVMVPPAQESVTFHLAWF